MSDQTTTHDRFLGNCPVCGNRLEAKVAVEVTLHRPSWHHGERYPKADASAKPVALSLHHECDDRPPLPRATSAKEDT